MREAAAVAGAVVGYVVSGFNPMGAYYGFTIGYAIGGLLEGPNVQQGPTLGDIPVQTSKDGLPIPIGWGIVYTMGNIIQVNPIQEVKTKERQGKGGGGTVVEYTNYLRTFAIGICRSYAGPIKGILRIWENDKLVYDMRDTPAIPIAETLAYAAKIRIYLGTEDQDPDPDLEAHMGTGNQPYYRGLSYVVWVNYDITDFAAAIPRYSFEVEVQGPDYVTSRVYALDPENKLQIALSAPSGTMDTIMADDFDTQSYFQDMTMRVALDTTDAGEDAFDTQSYFQDMTMRLAIETGDAGEDSMDTQSYFQTMTMREALVSQIVAPEGLQIGLSAPTGSMTAV